MPFVAYTTSDERIDATRQDKASWEILRKRNNEEKFRLIQCDSPVTLSHRGDTLFFAHKKGCSNEESHGGPESAEHIRAKEFLYRGALAAGWAAEIEHRSPDGSWIADVMAFGPNGQRVALEVQRSGQSFEKYRRRQVRYWNEGIAGFWFASHSKSTPARWDSGLGYSVVRIDMPKGANPTAASGTLANRLRAEHGATTLDVLAQDLLGSDYASTDHASQESIWDLLSHHDVDPALRDLTSPTPSWLSDAGARIRARAAEAEANRRAWREERERKQLAEQEQARIAAEQAAQRQAEKAAQDEELRAAELQRLAAQKKVRDAKAAEEAAKRAEETERMLAAFRAQREEEARKLRLQEEAALLLILNEAHAMNRAFDERKRLKELEAQRRTEVNTGGRNDAFPDLVAESAKARHESVSGQKRVWRHPDALAKSANNGRSWVAEQPFVVAVNVATMSFSCSACSVECVAEVRSAYTRDIECPGGCGFTVPAFEIRASDSTDLLDVSTTRPLHLPACTGHIGLPPGGVRDERDASVEISFPAHGCGGAAH